MTDKMHKVNVMLVDDNPVNLYLLESILKNLGENLVKVNSGEQALKLLLQEEFALILLDMRMPEMDGLETAALIKKGAKSPSTPIIFLSAFGEDEDYIKKGYLTGAVDYIAKPITPEILLAKVTIFVELFRKNMQMQQQQKQLQLERQKQFLEQIAAQASSSKAFPSNVQEKFCELVESYGDLLELGVAQQLYQKKCNFLQKLHVLVNQLGFCNASPGDVIEIHYATLKSKGKEAPQKVQIYTEEGYFVAMHLIAHLVSWYQRIALDPKKNNDHVVEASCES